MEAPDGAGGARKGLLLGAFDIHFDEIDARQVQVGHEPVDGGEGQGDELAFSMGRTKESRAESLGSTESLRTSSLSQTPLG